MRTKIAALITALLIIFVGAGGVYFISQSKPDVKGTISDVEEGQGDLLPENQSVRIIEEEVDTRTEDWLREIGQELDQAVLILEDVSFIWNLDEGSVEVLGLSIVVEKISETTLGIVFDFFESNGFEEDAYNLASGDTDQIYGFSRDEVVCLVRGVYTEQPEGIQETQETEPMLDLEIRCGLIDPEAIERLTQEFILKQLFSEKYEIETSTVHVDIIQAAAEHMSGSVQFIEPDEEQPPTGNGGAFLAATDDEGEWVLVFDGNDAILCADIEPYDFPLEMVPECYDDVNGHIVNRNNQQ